MTTIDGAQDANHDLRGKLWAVSGKRAVYPQLFIEEGGNYTFVGDFEAVSALVENDSEEHGLTKALDGVARKA